MAEADKDGRIAQVVSDMHAVLGMELHESLRVSQAEFDRVMAELDDPPKVVPPLLRLFRLRRP